MMMLICALLLIAASVIIALLAASPLFRTISGMIDCWADSVQGLDAERLG